MTNHLGPQLSGQAHPKPAVPALPADLADVALIDAPTCAAAGQMSLSWWYAEVAAGRAPQPVIRGPRCTRYRMVDVRAFWLDRATQAQTAPLAAEAIQLLAKKASAAGQAKRAAAAATTAAL